MNFIATRKVVKGRGQPPVSFLEELVAWGRKAPAACYEKNPAKKDLFAKLSEKLGPWRDDRHRLAVLLEGMRVHAGLEASWKFGEGEDESKADHLKTPKAEETGVFQVSWDSLNISKGAMKPFARAHDIETPEKFIAKMKTDHELAFTYYALLARITTVWAGPFNRGEVQSRVSRASVEEFITFLK